ncbi:MAG: hypothetical protein PWQ22_383 [Archaeoglobaceae archaeon]|nr:hypothetical protein [Archaeoglobaceae archaeon]
MYLSLTLRKDEESINSGRNTKDVKGSLIPGILMPLILISGTIISIAVNGSWSFVDNSIRELGRLGTKSAVIFNSSLIIASIIGILSLITFYFRVTGVERLSISFLNSAFIFLSLIGIFPIGSDLHIPICLGFVFSAFLSMSLLGISSAKKNRFLPTFTLTILFFCTISIILGFISVIKVAVVEIAFTSGFFIWYCFIAGSLLE